MREQRIKHAHGIAVAISLVLLSLSPMFLAVDHRKVFSATADLDLFVNPYFSIYVLALAAACATILFTKHARLSAQATDPAS